MDAITPEAAPGTGTVVHSGLTTREAFLAVETIARSQKAGLLDMVEVNPILDERNKTGILASELVQSALGKVGILILCSSSAPLALFAGGAVFIPGTPARMFPLSIQYR